MKATFRSGRIGSANHNDRSFRDGNRDGVKILFLGYKLGPKQVLEDLEMKWYETHYKASLEAQNERHRKSRHPERQKTVEALYRGRRTKPLETILQVGNRFDQPKDYALVNNALKGFVGRLVDKYKSNYHLLSISIHNDETTPHIHLRGVFDYNGPDGLAICQERALEALGIPLPHPDQPPGRYNCRLATWTQECREMWIEALREQGLQIEDPQKCNLRHQSTRDFWKQDQRQRERERLVDQDLDR